jgi:hypothetical protein
MYLCGKAIYMYLDTKAGKAVKFWARKLVDMSPSTSARFADAAKGLPSVMFRELATTP